MPNRLAKLDATAGNLTLLGKQTADDFQKQYRRAPKYLVAAPGRVNLIGEHTDYNGGFVLPMAIERYVVIAADKLSVNTGNAAAKVYSANMEQSADVHVTGPIERGPVCWSSYVQGVIAGFVDRGFCVPPFEAIIRSTVPLGGGLSSSAALEVATATLLESMLHHALDPVQKALLCQEAEHKFAGVPCGIMDQFSSTLCTADHLMLLDCRSQEAGLVPMEDPEIAVLIANSNVKHELTGGGYAKRRSQCEETAAILGIETLRDATMEQLETSRDRLDDVHFRRARHVIGEIDRTVKAAEAIRAGRWDEMGRLMYASHHSLRDDYEVSCDELDILVRLAEEIGPAGGVIGSRMTGGGFGGCTVSLVKTSAASAIAELLHERYQKRTGIEPTIFTSRPAQGACTLSC